MPKISDQGLSGELKVRAKQTVDLLTVLAHPELFTDVKQAVELTSNPLKPEVVADCKAMAFFELTKAGLGVTYGKGTGFVIQRLPKEGHQSTWSAPVFFKISQWGIGTSIGAEDVDIVTVFNDATLVQKMIHDPKTKFGADMFVPLNVNLLPGKPGNKVYTLTSGLLLLDFALTGTEIELDVERMEIAYGAAKSADAVLATDPLDELHPLYVALQTLTQQANNEAAQKALGAAGPH